MIPLLLACTPVPPATQGSPPVPADLLLGRLEGSGPGDRVSVLSVLRDTPLLVDPDSHDPGYPFVVEVLDHRGTVRYRASLREPVQLREQLEALDLGVDFFGLLPQLGDFAVRIPRDLAGGDVRFSRIEPDLTATDLGRQSLASLPDDPGLEVLGTQRIRGGHDPARSLDIAILGDGYTDAELDRFVTDAERAADGILAVEPYASFADRITVWRVDVASNESGAGFDCSDDIEVPDCSNAVRDTAFQSVFPLRLASLATSEPVTDEILFQLDQLAVQRAAAHVPFDTVIVLVNTPKFGAFGLWVTSIYTGDRMPLGVVHELGHAFALLGDEYVEAGNPCQQSPAVPDYPNIHPLVYDPADVRWEAWLTPGVALPTEGDDPDVVGLFQGSGAGCTDAYRPMHTCLMRRWGQPMCPICGEQTVKRLYSTFDAIDDVVVEDGVATAVSDVPLVGSWYVDGELAGEADSPLVLPPDAEDVRLVARPDDDRVRTRPEDLLETVVVRP